MIAVILKGGSENKLSLVGLKKLVRPGRIVPYRLLDTY